MLRRVPWSVQHLYSHVSDFDHITMIEELRVVDGCIAVLPLCWPSVG
jgi:hypothetical protein